MKRRILICDDEEGIRESLKLILQEKYDIIFSANGKQCLDCIKQTGDIDLLLLDIKMPKLNGLEILTQLKTANPNLKVIMVTGYKSVETATEAIQLGADDYIVKPFDSQDILNKVGRLLA
jgi:DNA-binding NtrC family response regulator